MPTSLPGLPNERTDDYPRSRPRNPFRSNSEIRQNRWSARRSPVEQHRCAPCYQLSDERFEINLRSFRQALPAQFDTTPRAMRSFAHVVHAKTAHAHPFILQAQAPCPSWSTDIGSTTTPREVVELPQRQLCEPPASSDTATSICSIASIISCRSRTLNFW